MRVLSNPQSCIPSYFPLLQAISLHFLSPIQHNPLPIPLDSLTPNYSPSIRISLLTVTLTSFSLSKLFSLQGIPMHHKDPFGFYLQIGKPLKSTPYAFLFLTCFDSLLQANLFFISNILFKIIIFSSHTFIFSQYYK